MSTEDGLGEIDVDQFPMATSYDEFIRYLGKVCESEDTYDTLVVDTLDWLEKLIWQNLQRLRLPAQA